MKKEKQKHKKTKELWNNELSIFILNFYSHIQWAKITKNRILKLLTYMVLLFNHSFFLCWRAQSFSLLEYNTQGRGGTLRAIFFDKCPFSKLLYVTVWGCTPSFPLFLSFHFFLCLYLLSTFLFPYPFKVFQFPLRWQTHENQTFIGMSMFPTSNFGNGFCDL